MNTGNQKNLLRESVDSWQQSANQEKKWALYNFIIAAAGVAPATLGIETSFSGDVLGGLVISAIGGAIAAYGVHEGLQDLNNYADFVSKVGAGQHMLRDINR